MIFQAKTKQMSVMSAYIGIRALVVLVISIACFQMMAAAAAKDDLLNSITAARSADRSSVINVTKLIEYYFPIGSDLNAAKLSFIKNGFAILEYSDRSNLERYRVDLSKVDRTMFASRYVKRPGDVFLDEYRIFIDGKDGKVVRVIGLIVYQAL